jgi:hypothetical protein
MARLGSSHFKSMYSTDRRVSIDTVLKMALLFPCFVEEEENEELMAEVSESELKEVLHSFQKDKISGPDGWSMEFFVAIFELISLDLLKFIEESRVNGFMYPPLNAIVIDLIPNQYTPNILDDYRPISLCNCIYKIIAKIIRRRIKGIHSK